MAIPSVFWNPIHQITCLLSNVDVTICFSENASRITDFERSRWASRQRATSSALHCEYLSVYVPEVPRTCTVVPTAGASVSVQEEPTQILDTFGVSGVRGKRTQIYNGCSLNRECYVHVCEIPDGCVQSARYPSTLRGSLRRGVHKPPGSGRLLRAPLSVNPKPERLGVQKSGHPYSRRSSCCIGNANGRCR